MQADVYVEEGIQPECCPGLSRFGLVMLPHRTGPPRSFLLPQAHEAEPEVRRSLQEPGALETLCKDWQTQRSTFQCKETSTRSLCLLSSICRFHQAVFNHSPTYRVSCPSQVSREVKPRLLQPSPRSLPAAPLCSVSQSSSDHFLCFIWSSFRANQSVPRNQAHSTSLCGLFNLLAPGN